MGFIHFEMIVRLISATFGGVAMLFIAGQVHALSIGNWVCSNGDWSNESCWNFTDFSPYDTGPHSLEDIIEARLIFSDGIDRTVIRSVQPDQDTQYFDQPVYTTIDATGTGTITLVHTAGFVGDRTVSQIIGDSGTGTLIQTGGFLEGDMTLGNNSGSNGTYNLINCRSGASENQLIVGNRGNGIVNQLGGGVSFEMLILGEHEGGTGTYNLVDGSAFAGFNTVNDNVWIGMSGNGTFNQLGGSLGTASGIIVGGKTTGIGAYNIYDGKAQVNSYMVVGLDGTGTLKQSGGEVTIASEANETSEMMSDEGLLIGYGSYSYGTYTLEAGTVTTLSYYDGGAKANIGIAGYGIFNQKGGSFEVISCESEILNGCDHSLGTATLNIGMQGGSSGSYNLFDGSSTSDQVNIGIGGHGEFNQTGGSHVVHGTLFIANDNQGGSGIYTLKGGTLETENIVVNKQGIFNFDGGSITTDLFANTGTLKLGDANVDPSVA